MIDIQDVDDEDVDDNREDVKMISLERCENKDKDCQEWENHHTHDFFFL